MPYGSADVEYEYQQEIKELKKELKSKTLQLNKAKSILKELHDLVQDHKDGSCEFDSFTLWPAREFLGISTDKPTPKLLCPLCLVSNINKHFVQPIRYGGHNAVSHYTCNKCGIMFIKPKQQG